MAFWKKEGKLDNHKIVTDLLSQIINNKTLSTPVYLADINCEKDAETIGVFPVIYVWNEDRDAGTFSISINGNAISHLLEGNIPRKHSQFNAIRDETISALSIVSQQSIVSTCEKLGAYPSEIFSG